MEVRIRRRPGDEAVDLHLVRIKSWRLPSAKALRGCRIRLAQLGPHRRRRHLGGTPCGERFEGSPDLDGLARPDLQHDQFVPQLVMARLAIDPSAPSGSLLSEDLSRLLEG